MTGHELTTPTMVWSYSTLLPVLLLSPESSHVIHYLRFLTKEEQVGCVVGIGDGLNHRAESSSISGQFYVLVLLLVFEATHQHPVRFLLPPIKVGL